MHFSKIQKEIDNCSQFCSTFIGKEKMTNGVRLWDSESDDMQDCKEAE